MNPAHAKVLQISYQQVRTKSEKREGILGLCSSLFPSKDCHKDNDIYTTWYVVWIGHIHVVQGLIYLSGPNPSWSGLPRAVVESSSSVSQSPKKYHVPICFTPRFGSESSPDSTTALDLPEPIQNGLVRPCHAKLSTFTTKMVRCGLQVMFKVCSRPKCTESRFVQSHKTRSKLWS